MTARFTDKVIVITGGSAGIGLACARAFLEEGARRVYITARRRGKLEAVCAELGERAIGVVFDVAEVADIELLKRQVSERDSHIDVLVANAGISFRNTLGETTEDAYRQMFDVNVKGMLFTVDRLSPLVADGGSIILLSSYAGSHGRPNLSIYAASKAAARSFARSFAVDLQARKIRVNAVSPGVIRTEIITSRPGLTPDQLAEIQEQIEQYCQNAAPAGRAAEATEVAKPVLFLASDEASYINGIELAIDGGMGQI